MISSFLRVGKKIDRSLFAIGQVHGYEVVVRDAVPEMGIAAKRRKGNAVPLGMESDWRPILGLTVTISSSLRPGVLGRAQRPTYMGYSCALTKLGSFRECHR